jgi:hypothetical protein
MNTWAHTFFTGWHFMRWLRLAIGIYAIGQAILMHDRMIGFLGAFFYSKPLQTPDAVELKHALHLL